MTILSKLYKQKKVPYGSEMAINSIKSEFRTSKMADRSEMTSNAIESDFRTSKWPPKKKILYRSELTRFAIESEFRTSKMVERSEMARNAIEGDFRTSKMAAGSNFVKIITKKSCINLKWSEMRSKVNLGHPKWPRQPFRKKNKK